MSDRTTIILIVGTVTWFLMILLQEVGRYTGAIH